MATDPDAELVYRAEALLERELPTRKLTLKEAQDLVNQISHAKDIDPPKVLHLPISRQFDALAVPSEQVIVVRTCRPTQLTVIHEMAHFLGGMNHGARFCRTYLEILQRFISINHHQFVKHALAEQACSSRYNVEVGTQQKTPI